MTAEPLDPADIMAEPLDPRLLAVFRKDVEKRPWDHPHVAELLDEVDRLAAALAAAQEREVDAWDAGHTAGWYDQADKRPETPNPYRAALDGEGAADQPQRRQGCTAHGPLCTGVYSTCQDAADQSQSDDRPHSRACGITPHPHGTYCNTNCLTCGGRDR